jgi:phage gp16-like protein
MGETPMTANEKRIALYRKIEVGRKQLPAMDEVAFRQLLQNEFGMESRKDMSIGQLSRLVQVLAELGAKFKAPAKSRNNRVTSNARPDFIEITDSMPFATQKRQILAIWRKLGYSMSSLDTRVKRAFGVHCFVWLKDEKQIVTLLSDLQRREKRFEQKQAV